VQELKAADKVKRLEFYEKMQLKIEGDGFVERLFFSNEATFHVSGKANRHNISVWGADQPHAQTEHQCESPKVNVSCAMSH
jgi:hypothetical protein